MPHRGLWTLCVFVVGVVFANAAVAQTNHALPEYVLEAYGNPPETPDSPLSPAFQFAARVAFVDSTALKTWGAPQEQALQALSRSNDPRLAWIISDMLRFTTSEQAIDSLTRTASDLIGKPLVASTAWFDLTNILMAWDIPAPPDYLDYKRAIFTWNIPGWEPLFSDGEMDWRLVSWGGVLIDARAYNDTDAGCNCIPALDNPLTESADEARWLDDNDIVFGIEINGEARAYPRRIMEVRELINDTVGGRDLAIPYCTLCGAAQAFFTDNLPEGIKRPVFRTSGLLSRSNKVMYDLNTYSLFDTFKGRAVNGPLGEQQLTLEQTSVVTSDWASWKATYPETTVVLGAYALGRQPDFRTGRDADGPIFPTGATDPRLPVQEDIVGAVTDAGQPVAFPRATAVLALRRGDRVAFDDVVLELSAGGIKTKTTDGKTIASHEAYWFAWSQFYPDTQVWMPSE